MPRPYRKYEINYIHEAKDDICHTSVPVDIGNRHYGTCDDMVREHLSMILPACFNVDNKDLLNPEC